MTDPPESSLVRSEQEMVTDALAAARDGEPGALDRVFPLVYEQLRGLAHLRLAGERSGHTLSTTALVQEAYVKLIDQTRAQWQDRAHFFAVAAGAMNTFFDPRPFPKLSAALSRDDALRAPPEPIPYACARPQAPS